MADHRLPPDERRIRNEMLRRIEALERRLSPDSPRVPIFESFSQAGTLREQVSGRYYPPRGGRLVSIIASLAVEGSESTVITCTRSGISLLETVTFIAGQAYEPIACSHFVDRNQYLQFEVVTAGAGAQFLTVQTEIIPGV